MAQRIALVIVDGQIEQLQDGDVLKNIFPPGQDGDVLTADNSQPYGVSWGLPRNRNAFVVSIPSNVSKILITFPVSFPNNVIPVVVCTPEFQASDLWVTDITNAQFVLNIKGSAQAYGRVNIIAMRTQ